MPTFYGSSHQDRLPVCISPRSKSSSRLTYTTPKELWIPNTTKLTMKVPQHTIHPYPPSGFAVRETTSASFFSFIAQNDQFCNQNVFQFNRSKISELKKSTEKTCIASDKWEPVVNSTQYTETRETYANFFEFEALRDDRHQQAGQSLGPNTVAEKLAYSASCHGEILDVTEFYCLS